MRLLWRQRWPLLVVLVFLLSETLVSGEHRQQHVATKEAGHKGAAKAPTSSSLSPRKMDVDRQGGTLAGPMFLGLATMLFPVLPVLLLAPLAMAGIGPLRDYIGGGSGTAASSPISDIINSIGGGSSSGSEPSTSGSALSSVAQALGLSSGSGGAGESGASLLSGLFGSSSGSSPSGSGSLLSSLFDSSGPTLLGSASNAGSGSSVFGNAAAGSRPVPSIALPPNKQTSSSPGISSADLLGAAVAALDNAGVLGSLSGLGSGGSAAAIQQLLSVAGVGGGSGSSAGRPATASSSALTEILNGIGSNLAGSASAPVPTFSAASTQKLPQLGASLSSNIIQGLPAAGPGGVIHQGVVNGVAGAAKPSGGSLSNLLGLGASQSGSFQKLANNAINSITNFLFSRRRSGGAEWPTVPHYPEFLLGATKSKGRLFAFFREAFGTLKDGIRRYEITETDCQARLICEMQKPMGRSFRSWTNSLLDLVGVESYLDQSKFGARTKSTLKDFYQAARNGLTEKDCAVVYNKCPVAVAIEPMRNSVISKIISHPQPSAHVQRPSILSYIQSVVPKVESKQQQQQQHQAVPHVSPSTNYHQQQPAAKPQPGVIGEAVAQSEPLTFKKQPQQPQQYQQHSGVQSPRL